jgi:hypothetical protein
MWYTATSASVTNGATVVAITTGDDISIIQEDSGLIFEGESPVQVKRGYIDGSGEKFIQLQSPWPYTSKTNQPLVSFPTDASFAEATAELRRVIDTLSVASTTEAQAGTDDEKIMTPLKVKQVIDTRSASNLVDADILQSEGTATDKLMSQNAVTEAIQQAVAAANSNLSYSSTVWDSVSDTTEGEGITTGVTEIHKNMKRCLLLDNGTVNYYLNPNDSTLKANGGASNLTGADGQVMVEIPKCYVKVQKVGNDVTWSVSSESRLGYVLHPAFTKDGTLQYDNKLDMWYYVGVTQELDYIYVGVYQASVFDVSASAYIDGLNSDNNTGRVDTVADKLSSVSGKYPMVGLTRAEFRSIANNRGAGWGEIDFWTHSLLQLLYTTEYRNLNSQAALAQGVVSMSGGYPPSSNIQVDSPHSNAGKSNSIGNQSGGVESTVRDVPWMSYRGVENFWGNCWVWIDGVNILDQVYYINNTGTFADNTAANGYLQLGTQSSTDNGYIRNVQNNTLGFIPESVAGGSSNIAFSDYYYQSTGYRVMAGGGRASYGALAGAFFLSANASSGTRYRGFGGRVVYK